MTTADAPGPVEVTICAHKEYHGCCAWSDTVKVMWCPARKDIEEDPYFVYKLKDPISCNMAYCVEDSCPKGLEWDYLKLECVGKKTAPLLLCCIELYVLYRFFV